MPIKRIFIVTLGSSFLLFFSSCHFEKSKVFGGTLKIGIFVTPTEMNPITTDSGISANLLDLIYDPLVKVSGDGKIEPLLAERWEISPDQKTWTFFLRKDVSFHDGTPLRAEDIQYMYEAIKKQKRVGYTNFLLYVNEVRVMDPYTVQIILSKPDHSLWGGLGVFGIAPKHLLEKDPNYLEFNRHPTGSGPFRFVKQDKEEVVLEANDRYFQGRPYLDRIIVRVLPSQTACLSHLIAGKVDMAFLLNPEDYGALAQIPAIKIYNNWNPTFYMIMLNMKEGVFSSPKVRQALNLAVNRALIFNKVLDGKGFLTTNTVFPLEERREEDAPPYHPKQTLELLKEEGWKERDENSILIRNGNKFEFTTLVMGGDEVGLSSLRMIQQQLMEVGIKMNVLSLPFDEYVDRIFRKRNFQSLWINFVYSPLFDNNFLFWHTSQIQSGLNFASYSNPKIDRFLDEARLSFDPEKRHKANEGLQEALREDPPGIFLFWRQMPIALQSRFRGVPEKRMESLRDLIHVWLPQEDQKSQ